MQHRSSTVILVHKLQGHIVPININAWPPVALLQARLHVHNEKADLLASLSIKLSTFGPYTIAGRNTETRIPEDADDFAKP